MDSFYEQYIVLSPHVLPVSEIPVGRASAAKDNILVKANRHLNNANARNNLLLIPKLYFTVRGHLFLN